MSRPDPLHKAYDCFTDSVFETAVTRSRRTSDGNSWQAEGAEIQSTTANWQLTAFALIVG